MRDSVRLTDSENDCPLCGHKSKVISIKTVKAFVKDEFKAQIRKDHYFLCTDKSCEVTYFNGNKDIIFYQQGLKEDVWYKDNAKTKYVCYCDKVTEEEIINAIKNGAYTLDALKRVLPISQHKNCKVNNPTGECCEKYIEQYIKKYS